MSPTSPAGRVELTSAMVDGWEHVTLRSPVIEVTVVPRKGADIVSLKHRERDVELLWRTRWGLRPPGLHSAPGSPEALAMESYSGGWNTIFPNAGTAAVEHGVEWGMHGEAWIAPFSWELIDDALVCRTSLVRSPFTMVKTIRLTGGTVSVTEAATNVGGEDIEVQWCQHPAFAPPLLSAATRLETNARTVNFDVADPRFPVDREPDAWPWHTRFTGERIDLSSIDSPGSGTSRRAFIGDFADPRAWVSIANPALGLGARLEWDAADFPFAWYWFEGGGRSGFPWYSNEYVLAIEPATGYPSGIEAARRLTGTQRLIPQGSTASHTVSVTVDTVDSH